MKFGYQGGFDNPSQTYTYFNEVILVRMNNGVPNRLTQVVSNDHTNIKIVRNLIPTSFYGQDQWTTGRLTLQGGVRYDHLLTTYPDQFFGGPGYNASAPALIDYPSRSTQGVNWNDVTPSGWARPTTCSATARRPSSSTSASIWKPSRRPIRTST